MKKREIYLLIFIVLAFCISGLTAFARDAQEVRQSSVRLHILANSDSQEDQALKLKVRDRILKDCSGLFSTAYDAKEAKAIAQEHIQEIESIAKDELLKNGSDYALKVHIVNMYFNTREYEDFTMPSGYYDAVRVEIGSAQGKNWWCVLFPPMCLPAAQADDSGEEERVEEYKSQHELVNEKPQYEMKFALLEFFEKLLQF